MTLDEIVTVNIKATLPALTRGAFVPVIMSYDTRFRSTVKCYTHWTQLALSAFGNPQLATRARRWLKRKRFVSRKKRRGW